MGADFDGDEFEANTEHKELNEIDAVVDEWIRFVLKYGNLNMLNMVLECWDTTGHNTEMQTCRILQLKKEVNNTWLTSAWVRTIILNNRFHQTAKGSLVSVYAEKKKSTIKFDLLNLISSLSFTKTISKLLDESPFYYQKEEIKSVVDRSAKLKINFNQGYTFLSCWLTYWGLLPTSRSGDDNYSNSCKRQEIANQLANSDNLFLIFENRIHISESVNFEVATSAKNTTVATSTTATATATESNEWKNLEDPKNFAKRQVHEALVTIYFCGNHKHFRNQYGFIQYGGDAIVTHCKQVEKELCVLNQRDLQGLVTHYV